MSTATQTKTPLYAEQPLQEGDLTVAFNPEQTAGTLVRVKEVKDGSAVCEFADGTTFDIEMVGDENSDYHVARPETDGVLLETGDLQVGDVTYLIAPFGGDFALLEVTDRDGDEVTIVTQDGTSHTRPTPQAVGVKVSVWRPRA